MVNENVEWPVSQVLDSITPGFSNYNEKARLALDRALGRLYTSPDFRALYAKWFGEPDADTVAFYRQITLPE